MACGDANVFRSGALDRADPLGCVEVGRIEAGGSLGILLVVYATVEIPFALGKHAVYAPMEKDAEAVVGKFLLGLSDFVTRCVGHLCGGGERVDAHRGGQCQPRSFQIFVKVHCDEINFRLSKIGIFL